MSDTSLVVYCKISREDYNSLTIKDEDTLYVVNDNGDFSMANLSDSAELYLGNKKLFPAIVGTTGQSTTAIMHQKAVTDAINGLQSDIEAKSEDFYGECNISPSTVAKTVTTLNGGFILKKGAKVSVKFLQGHAASTMTLNVDGTGAKNVYRDGNSPKSNMIKAYNVYEFVYDGTYWRIVGVDTDTTYSPATTSSQGLMSSADKTKLDSIDLSKYLPKTGGTVTGEFRTNALTHLANSGSAVLQAFPQSEATGVLSAAIGYRAKVSGNYSIAIGYSCNNFGNNSAVIGYASTNGRMSADTSKPYITMSYFRPLSITVEGADVYSVNIPKGESVSYIYNGVEYTAENTNTTYSAILTVIEDTARDILDVPITYASIYNSTQNISNMRILSITEISDTIFAIVINGQGKVLSDNLYRSYVALPIKTNSSQYSGQGGINCGYATDSTGRFSFTSGEQSFNGSSNSIINGRFNYADGSYISVFGQGNTVITPNGSFVTGINNFVSAANFISGNYNLAVHNNTKILGDNNITTAQNQIIIGKCNDTNSNSLFIVANGTSNTNRKNIFEVSSTGVLIVFDNIIPNVENKDIGSSSKKWRNIYADKFKGNADTATKVNNVLTINHNGTTKTYDGSSAVTIDIASGGSSSGESSIQLFIGFMTGTDMGNIVDQSTVLTGGQVYCSQSKNRFYYKVNGLFYSNFPNASLYNDNYDTSSATAKNGAIFSYNGKHYTMYNGTLQDMSVLDDNGNMTTAGIVKLSDVYSGAANNYGADSGIAATPKAVSTAFSTMKTYVDNKATQSLQYTDSQIDAKIQLVTALPAEPTSGVLYLIAES